MEIFSLGRQLSQDFIVVSANENSQTCLARLSTTRAAWAVVTRETPEDGMLYYVLNRQVLQDSLLYSGVLDPIAWGLFLREEGSNTTLEDGWAFHPRRGRGLNYDGQFAPAAVFVNQAVPTAILFPLAAVEDVRRSETTEHQAEDVVDCSLGAEFPESLAVGEIRELEVTLAAGLQELSSNQAIIQLSPSNEVVVKLSLSDNLRLRSGRSTERIRVPTPQEPRALLFEIEGVRVGSAQIILRLYQPGRAAEQVGYLTLRPSVTKDPVGQVEALHTIALAYPPSGLPTPDLILYIEEHPSGNGNKVVIKFRITVGPRYPEPFEDYDCGRSEDLEVDPALYFHQRFQRIDGHPLINKTHTQTLNYTLRQEGEQLYTDLFSQGIRRELEQRGHLISSIQIKTSGHHIPWEMILLPPLQGSGEYPERPKEFLAQRYEVTRWTEGYSPPAQINLRDFLYIAPGYEGPPQLHHAREEVAYIESLHSRGIVPKKLPAEPLPIFEAVDKGGFGVLHYVGHASQTSGDIRHSQLELEPDKVLVGRHQYTYLHSLEPTHVANKGSSWGAYRPLVFFNACQTGLSDVRLIRTGGWATTLLNSKAGAFVGTLWSVRDSAALLFAQTFYNMLLQGETFGKSALAARKQVAATEDPSWLAYVVYAHPNARAGVYPAS